MKTAVPSGVDTGTEPMMIFSPTRLGSTSITTRPLFECANNNNPKMQTFQLPSNAGTCNLQATELGTGIYFCSLVNGAEVLATQKVSVVRA